MNFGSPLFIRDVEPRPVVRSVGDLRSVECQWSGVPLPIRTASCLGRAHGPTWAGSLPRRCASIPMISSAATSDSPMAAAVWSIKARSLPQMVAIMLLAPEVRNEGVLSARLGTVAMAAGEAVTLNLEGERLLSGASRSCDRRRFGRESPSHRRGRRSGHSVGVRCPAIGRWRDSRRHGRNRASSSRTAKRGWSTSKARCGPRMFPLMAAQPASLGSRQRSKHKHPRATAARCSSPATKFTSTRARRSMPAAIAAAAF